MTQNDELWIVCADAMRFILTYREEICLETLDKQRNKKTHSAYHLTIAAEFNYTTRKNVYIYLK
jgi:hypothetical protein